MEDCVSLDCMNLIHIFLNLHSWGIPDSFPDMSVRNILRHSDSQSQKCYKLWFFCSYHLPIWHSIDIQWHLFGVFWYDSRITGWNHYARSEAIILGKLSQSCSSGLLCSPVWFCLEKTGSWGMATTAVLSDIRSNKVLSSIPHKHNGIYSIKWNNKPSSSTLATPPEPRWSQVQSSLRQKK